MSWKLATFNVNGIRARLGVVVEWLKQHNPNVLCLQEIKCQEDMFPREPFLDIGYELTLRGQKGFNGVAILSKGEPQEVLREFSDGRDDIEARMLAALVDGVWVVNTYVPQGRSPDDPAFQYKLDFFYRLELWFETRFDPSQPVVWVGDLNVAPSELDVFDPKRMDGMVGFHPAERKALTKVVDWGFTDLFRKHHPGERQFTFWDYRLPAGFARNLGWRLDHIMTTKCMAGVAVECYVDTAPRGKSSPSDHTPVLASFDLDRLNQGGGK
ncbi:MAG: exodeoxyribonuclease III [Syntrophobacteraceae bacterium]